jgi:hypothetical protein
MTPILFVKWIVVQIVCISDNHTHIYLPSSYARDCHSIKHLALAKNNVLICIIVCAVTNRCGLIINKYKFNNQHCFLVLLEITCYTVFQKSFTWIIYKSWNVTWKLQTANLNYLFLWQAGQCVEGRKWNWLMASCPLFVCQTHIFVLLINVIVSGERL